MNFQDIERSKLRVIVAEIDNQIPALSTQISAAGEPGVAARFAVSWAALVELLALGPEPEVRRCPFCMATIQQTAARCMHCWKQSSDAGEPSPGRVT